MKTMFFTLRKWRGARPAVSLSARLLCFWPLWGLMFLAGCAPEAYRQEPVQRPVVRAERSPAALAQVYFYPERGQTTEQQSRDHYECYSWAVKQTGFDPGQSSLPAEERVRVVPMPPPGHDTVAFAIAGAVLGALVGGPRYAAVGAVAGAAGGIIVGSVSDAARMEAAQQQEERYAAQNRASAAKVEGQVAEFKRAMSACLEGRGYRVR